MRRVLALLLVMLAARFCCGATSMLGGSGLLKLQSARTSPRGLFVVILNGEYTQDEYPRSLDGLIMTDRHHYFEGRFGLSYAVLRFLESYMRIDMFGMYDEENDQVRERPDTYSGGLGAAELGLKMGVPLLENTESGIALIPGTRAYVNLAQFSPPSGNKEMADKGFLPYSGHSPDAGIDLLLDFEVRPLAVHAAVGYLGVGKAREAGRTRNNEIHWGFGAGIQAGPYVAIVGEVLGERLVDRLGSAVDTVWLCPGLRFLTPVGVIFDFAAEFALQDFDFVPDDRSGGTSWNILFGLSVSSQLIKKKAEPPGIEVAGKVTDKETGEPIGATITFSGGSHVPVVSDPETGLYRVQLREGGVRIKASKDGYRWKEKPVPTDAEQNVLLDFELSRKGQEQGTLTGVIKDYRTQAALGAEVVLLDLEGFATTTDLTTGIYKLKVPAGTHNVKVTASKYEETVVPVAVEAGKTTIKNIVLKEKVVKKKMERIILRGIVFASGKATIAPSSYPALEKALETLRANPNMRVEIGGHTDSVGSASSNMKLSLARANSVRNWLKSRGISPERLVARGYGESIPIASNRTKQGRSENRRIEFVILSR
ncbi:MAG: OmpA family protein [bacterium]